MFENEHINKILPYKIASQKVWESKDRSGILKLDWNESTVGPSPKVFEKISDILKDDFIHLYPNLNNTKLIKYISEYCGVLDTNVQYFAGSDAIHEYIIRCFLCLDDRVLIVGPTYDNFRLNAESAGSKIYNSNCDSTFIYKEDKIVSDIKKYKPKMVYLCNPNNPTGYLHSMNFIEELTLSFGDVLFLIDEAYFEFSSLTVSKLAIKNKNIIISRTFSKAFGLANFRVGYVISSNEIIATINKIRNPKNISTISQEAAIAALSDIDYTTKYISEVKDAKKIFFDQIKKNELDIRFGIKKIIGGYGNYILIQFSDNKKQMSFFNFLKRKNIFIRLLSHTNILEHCLRITIGTPSQMRFVLKELDGFS